ncbi:MAG: double-strand break repair protein AddB, partial [Hyphomicrobiaceae bacterium]
RGLQQAFLGLCRGGALLLPRLCVIGEDDDDFLLLAGLAEPAPFGLPEADIPPAIGELERRLALTQFVLAWSERVRIAAPAGGAATPAQALRLAAELARLMDTVESEGKSPAELLAGLDALVPDTFSEQWRQTLEFLHIAVSQWPGYVAKTGRISAVDRQNRLLRAEARRLAAGAGDGPTILAGLTGSTPAVADLMSAAAMRSDGAVVLPGLDLTLDEASWQTIGPAHPEHPQFALKTLLDRLGVARADVQALDDACASETSPLRTRIVGEALRPAAATERWQEFIAAEESDRISTALAGVELLEAPSAQDEAEAIALILREAFETPGRTAALATPDRLLARRVAVRLAAWGLAVDDTALRPLGKTSLGTFLDLVLEAVCTGFAPVATMALLKHPLTRLQLPAAQFRRGVQALEVAVFRTVYLGRGLADAVTALNRAAYEADTGRRHGHAGLRLTEQDWQAARDLVQRLAPAVQPLTDVFGASEPHALAVFARAHATTAERLAAAADGGEYSPLWQGPEGETAAHFFASVLDPSLPAPHMAAVDYPDFYRSLLGSVAVRTAAPAHPRLFVWSPFEARLQHPDVVVLGSLNEGTWPEAGDPGPWLNRPMRTQLGLPQPEHRIGAAAHDFTQLLGVPQVYLTRAAKVDGVPTVASRWLLRILALSNGFGLQDPLAPCRPWLAWARSRDDLPERKTVPAPTPRPPVTLRPRRLSVSDIETWIANPYGVFAAKILKLDPLPVLGPEPDAALRGSIVHRALSRFTRRFPQQLPADCARELMNDAETILAEFTGNARIAAFWVRRFQRFAEWFADTEPDRRKQTERIVSEVAGKHVLAGPAGPFTLVARADRIDASSGALVITDYKTGSSLRSLARDAVDGVAPQLALEALIATAGGFAGLQAGVPTGLRYISAAGGEPPGAEIPVKASNIGALADEAGNGLKRLIAAFDRETTPYKAVRRARFTYTYDAYAHLARVAEWSGASDVEPQS